MGAEGGGGGGAGGGQGAGIAPVVRTTTIYRSVGNHARRPHVCAPGVPCKGGLCSFLLWLWALDDDRVRWTDTTDAATASKPG